MSQLLGASSGGSLVPGNFADSPVPSVSLTAIAGTAITAKRSDEILALDVTAAYAFSGLGATTIIRGVTGYTRTNDAALEIAFDGDTYNAQQLTAYSNASSQFDGPFFFGRFAYGTPSSPTVVGAQAVLVGFAGTGYNSSSFPSSKVSFTLQTAEAWSTSANGTEIVFQTTPNGSTTKGTALTIQNDKTVKLGADLIFSTFAKWTASSGVMSLGNAAGVATGASLLVNGGIEVNPAANFGFSYGYENNNLQLGKSVVLQWTSGNIGGTADTFVLRATAATIQFGAVAADTTGVSQTIQAQGVTTGGTNNQAGGNLTIASGQGKGNVASSLIFQTPAVGGSGNTLQTMTTALTINSSQQLIGIAGAVGSPTIGFGSTNTGFFSPTAGTNIGVAIGGVMVSAFANYGNLVKAQTGTGYNFVTNTTGAGVIALQYSSATALEVNNTGLGAYLDLKARDLYTVNANFMLRSGATITGGATGNVPTLTAGPVTGNPTKWLPYDDNGTTRYIPAW
jgi:hypothetical protein